MTTDTYHQRFAVITARPDYDALDEPAYRYKTCGHAAVNCPAIKPTSTLIDAESLAEFMERNEFFDGEVVYAAPFRCRVCHAATTLHNRPQANHSTH